ncbi:MAG: class I SAM-dependent methyltransferase [Hyphomonas sp.]
MDNTAQIDYWNGPAGQKWVRDADRLDVMLAPFAEAVISGLALQPGNTVLDIGCGAGAVSLGIAASAINVSVTGVDVSEPLVNLARRRAAAVGAPVEFVVADAAVWQPKAPLDFAVSRFGVMFFADPVAAFANIHAGLRKGGRLSFACWRPLTENEWALAPLQAAMPLLAAPPQMPEPGAPGPFAFGDADHVRRILSESGWSEITITPWDGRITLPGSSAAETADFMLDIGPLARAVAEQGVDLAPIRAAIEARVGELAGPGGRTQLKAAAWIVGARA